VSSSHLNLTTLGTTNANYIGFGTSVIPALGVHLSELCVSGDADFDTTTNYLNVSFTDASTSSTTGGAISAWSWDFGDGNTSTSQNPTHTYADSGTYIVCLTVFDNCGSATTCDTLSVDKNYTGLNENWIDNVNVYPIPASDIITIDGLQFEGEYMIELVDLAGKVVRAFNFNSEKSITLDLTREVSGSYLLRIGNSEIKGTKSILILK